ncbi:MAG TPA: hypothetical protein VN419_08095 [Humidesulfovibrio sp.]|uniref:hypothetical protein n=1 Tax=Humidesulfovibrio sp. TaxID=2910988 RepID=UPI002B6BC0AB|nr:hypothetical protein [Humidesulfovibrio sp.]HWR03969.1 hypothetical protein [Humidesulfovibrio sp.]
MDEVKQDVLDSFQTMWGLYPGPVLLVHASRKILAVNKVAEGLGIATGIACHSLHGGDKPCKGCLANKALRQGEGVRSTAWSPLSKKYMDAFWSPVAGEKDIYVHFGNDITEFVRAELLPAE